MGNKTDRNSLKRTLPKLLRIQKKSSHVKYRFDAVDSGVDAGGRGFAKKRTGFYHRDVEEALSSLLWQPYEYQNAGAASRTSANSSDDHSSASDDLERRTVHYDGTHDRCTDNDDFFTDLHLPTAPPEEMVINLPPRVRQSVTRYASRDRRPERLSRSLSASEATVAIGNDVNGNMPVNVPLLPDASLSSVNVVGLPPHARHASVPAPCNRSAQQVNVGSALSPGNRSASQVNVSSALSPGHRSAQQVNAGLPIVHARQTSEPRSPQHAYVGCSLGRTFGQPSDLSPQHINVALPAHARQTSEPRSSQLVYVGCGPGHTFEQTNGRSPQQVSAGMPVVHARQTSEPRSPQYVGCGLGQTSGQPSNSGTQQVHTRQTSEPRSSELVYVGCGPGQTFEQTNGRSPQQVSAGMPVVHARQTSEPRSPQYVGCGLGQTSGQPSNSGTQQVHTRQTSEPRSPQLVSVGCGLGQTAGQLSNSVTQPVSAGLPVVHTRQTSEPRSPQYVGCGLGQTSGQPSNSVTLTQQVHTRQTSEPRSPQLVTVGCGLGQTSGQISDSSTQHVNVGMPDHLRQTSEPRSPQQVDVGQGRQPSDFSSPHLVTVGCGLDRTCGHPGDIATQQVHARPTSEPRAAQPANVGQPRPTSEAPQQVNISNVDVDFYRAVPVTVVSSVPTIRCSNSSGRDGPGRGNEVSNVQVVPLGSGAPAPAGSSGVYLSPSGVSCQRTFTSTEAQTDDVGAVEADCRERRRRGRRERRQQRRSAPADARLPDLLHDHQPPPYNLLPNLLMPPPPVMQTVVPNNVVPHDGYMFRVAPPPQGLQGHRQAAMAQAATAVPLADAASGFRFPFPVAGFNRDRFPEDHHPKGCCGLLSWKPGSLRWFIALIALVAVCCVLVGTALGAMRPSGRDHLTVSLLMIGVGVVLVTVSGVAWRLTSPASTSTCRSMFGLSPPADPPAARRFAARLPPAFGRPPHPYAAMVYPEFRCRPPPPSYQASMQEYRLRLLLLERGGAGEGVASPPPGYRSRTGSLLRLPLSGRRGDPSQSEYSCPPSYRSQTSVSHQGTVRSASRDRSLSVGGSDLGDPASTAVDSIKMAAEHDAGQASVPLDGGKSGNLVTIVQTDDRTPVIVTVSGNSQTGGSNSVRIAEVPSDVEILAHL